MSPARRVLAACCAMGGAAPLVASCAADVAGGADAAASTELGPSSAAPVPSSGSSASGSARPALPPTAPDLGADDRTVAACSSDADCGFDDPCVPQRCVAAKLDAGQAACEETAPAPGVCLCLQGGCTLEPTAAPAPTGTCEVRGCRVDRAGGKCVADTGGVAEGLRTNPRVEQGPSCDCIEPAKGCVFSWFDPIPCKSELDCWVDPSPRPHPVKRPAHLRRPFRPCKDGEIPPICEGGKCALGGGYRC